MPTQYPKVLASSQDPTQLSLTIESGVKLVLGLLAAWGVHQGVDTSAVYSNLANAQSGTQQVWDVLVGLVGLSTQAAPLVYSLFQGIQMVWGAIRKVLSMFKKN